MKRIAVLVNSNLNNRKGLINAFINRVNALSIYQDFKIEVYNLQFQQEEISLLNIFKCRQKKKTVDNCEFNIIYSVEYISKNKYIQKVLRYYNKFYRIGYWDKGWIYKFAKKFKDYDLLSVHSRECAYIADFVKNKYGIPYVATWHGSDIHTIPYEFPVERSYIVKAIENANNNFFVSKALLNSSIDLTNNSNKCVLYNGINNIFYKYNTLKQSKLREKLNIDNEIVISFAGELRDIKNAVLLPDIFKKINELCNYNIVFWIIGDGIDRNIIQKKISENEIKCVLWGNQPIQYMPDLLNCTDILILPSKNEGLPLICIEALACGANVVGSKVGGIPEAIGEDFSVPLGENFIERFAEKIVEILKNKPEQMVDLEKFNWNNTAKQEYNIYKEILN